MQNYPFVAVWLLESKAFNQLIENIELKRLFSPRTSEKAQRFGRRIIATSGSQANGSGRKASPFENDSSDRARILTVLKDQAQTM